MGSVSFEIDPQEVLRLQGYRRPSDTPTREVLDILQDAIAEGRQVFQPRWLCREFRVASVDRRGCRLEGGAEVLIRDLPERWGPIATLGLCVCTIGNAIEDRIERLFARREFPLACMLDSLGSVAAEALAEALVRQVCAERLSRGLKVTPRLSPGYPRWPIEEQRKVFALLPGDEIGVRLNPYCIMTPRKSVSFAVGIGPEAKMGSRASPCQSCDMRGCAYRRAPRRGNESPPWATGVGPLVLDVSQGTLVRA
jgi:hypothetical protein